MKSQQITYVNNHKVSCKGDDVSTEHPLIYLEIKKDQIICPYCSKIFKLKEN